VSLVLVFVKSAEKYCHIRLDFLLFVMFTVPGMLLILFMVVPIWRIHLLVQNVWFRYLVVYGFLPDFATQFLHDLPLCQSDSVKALKAHILTT